MHVFLYYETDDDEKDDDDVWICIGGGNDLQSTDAVARAGIEEWWKRGKKDGMEKTVEESPLCLRGFSLFAPFSLLRGFLSGVEYKIKSRTQKKKDKVVKETRPDTRHKMRHYA